MRPEMYVGPKWTFRVGQVLTAVSLSLAIIAVVIRWIAEDARSTLIFVSLCTTLSFSIQQYVLSAAEGPLPSQVPVNLAAVLTFCVVIAVLVQAQWGTVNEPVSIYWLLFNSLLIAVASGAMIAARFHATAGAGLRRRMNK